MRFTKALRLLQSPEFKSVFDKARRVRRSRLTFLFRDNALNHPRLGLVVAKKQFKQAVTRNRIKRKLRESFRLHQAILPGVDIVAIPKRGLDQLTSSELSEYIDQTLERLVKSCVKR